MAQNVGGTFPSAIRQAILQQQQLGPVDWVLEVLDRLEDDSKYILQGSVRSNRIRQGLAPKTFLPQLQMPVIRPSSTYKLSSPLRQQSKFKDPEFMIRDIDGELQGGATGEASWNTDALWEHHPGGTPVYSTIWKLYAPCPIGFSADFIPSSWPKPGKPCRYMIEQRRNN